MKAKLPLVYACSGCSSVAQLANTCALRLDRLGQAQMSCISGVGGGVTALVKLAQSGRPILALDGCSLACVKACLARAQLIPTTHLILNLEGARKRFGIDASEQEESAAWQVIENAIAALSPLKK